MSAYTFLIPLLHQAKSGYAENDTKMTYDDAWKWNLLGAAFIIGGGLSPMIGIGIYETYFNRSHMEEVNLRLREKAEFEEAYGRVGVAQGQLNAVALSLEQAVRERAYQNLLEAVDTAINEGIDLQKLPHLRIVDEQVSSLTSMKENLELILETKQREPMK